jgi:hypothetical protein
MRPTRKSTLEHLFILKRRQMVDNLGLIENERKNPQILQFHFGAMAIIHETH